MTQVEQQQYVEKVMKEELDRLNDQIEESQEMCRKSITKQQEAQRDL